MTEHENSASSYRRDAGSEPADSAPARIASDTSTPRPGKDEGKWITPKWETVRNTDDETIARQIAENLKLGLQNAAELPQETEPVAIICGGPSLKTQIDNLRTLKNAGVKLWGVNGVPDYLEKQGISVDVHVILDAKPHNVRFLSNSKPDVRYFIASQCHPDVFALLKAENRQLYIWHGYYEGIQVNGVCVGGPGTVGGKAICLALLMGHKQQYIFGMEGSYLGEAHHAYEQAENNGQLNVFCKVAGREFFCPRWGVHQAEQFIEMLPHLIEEGAQMTLFGDGLLQWWVKHSVKEEGENG